MRLHWSPRSPFVRKVMVAAHEAGLADRLQLTRTVVASHAPNRMLLLENPLGKLPTLVLPDGRVLFDSPVIIEYFAQLAPHAGLLPPEGADRLPALRHQALGDGLLDIMLLWLDERRRSDAARDTTLLEAFALKFGAVMDRLEAEVADLRARRFDIGHISIGCGLSYVGFRFPDLAWQAERPAAAEWLAEFHARPSVQAVPVVDDLDSPIQPDMITASH
jgi:glutathione S-transferase